MIETDEQTRQSAETFAHQLAALAGKMLSGRLCGAYLLGSLAHGGFSRRYSDLDFGLAVDGGLRQDELDELRARALRLSPFWTGRLSIFWSDERFTTGRMGSNDDAVAFVQAEAPKGLDVPCIERALACRHAAADPVDLWNDRELLPRQVAACRALMAR